MANFDFGQSPLPWDLQRHLDALLAAQAQGQGQGQGHHPNATASGSTSSQLPHHQHPTGLGADSSQRHGGYRDQEDLYGFMDELDAMGQGRDGHFGQGGGGSMGVESGSRTRAEGEEEPVGGGRSSLQVPFFRWCEYRQPHLVST